MQSNQQQIEDKPISAFILSLISGLWMLGVGITMTGWNSQWGPTGMMGGWMGGHGVMGIWTPWLSIITGAAILISAVILYLRPRFASTWGIVILIASVLNFFAGMGGFFASIIGILGGSIALLWDQHAERH